MKERKFWFDFDYPYDYGVKNKETKERQEQNTPQTSNYRGSNFWSINSRQTKKGFADKLNKSNTLVIHCQDSSTDMLSQIYKGKGWDVLRDGSIDDNELRQLLESHERIVMLGHGTPGGLINVQAGGCIINSSHVDLLKDKKLFVIWCRADAFFRRNNIGYGNFITKNVPSEVWEARAVGYNVTSEWMLENITYWSKCCADVVDIALEGNPEEAVRIAREKYQERYGNIGTEDEIGVTDYNTDAIQVLRA